jgi:hypothetical protein
MPAKAGIQRLPICCYGLKALGSSFRWNDGFMVVSSLK